MREKVVKSRNTVFFQCFVAPGGRKVIRLAKATGAETYWPDERSKIARRCDAKHIWTLCDVEKVHAVLARSTFGSENVQNTTAPELLLDIAMWQKWHALAKHIWK